MPEPLQEEQVEVSVPGSAFDPLHVEQISYLSIIISFSVPNADSSKEIVTGSSKSLPEVEFDSVLEEPPKKASKRTTGSSDQKKIDEILDKISTTGYESLTKEEKDFLFQAGKK